MTIATLFDQAELALASYTSLLPGSTSAQANITALQQGGDGLSAKQAEEFAKKYPTVVTQFNDTVAEGGLGTSFSATVFADASGNLTLAIRGTLEAGDFVPTDANMASAGAAYDQIVAMWNWWQRVSNPSGTTVAQYRLVSTPANPAQAVYIQGVVGYWLEPMTPAAANGALVSAINGDADHKLDIAGHSLGGHLAMAFGALFPAVTNQVIAFDAPGFIANSNNQSFFATLGGALPTGVATTNVIADEARGSAAPWSAFAGMNSRPGATVDIPIENQANGDEPFSTRPFALNHSQQTLTDALAVYAALAKLDASLSSVTFKAILNAATVGTSASLERIVDALESAFGINTEKLASGNANRDALYQALYGLQSNMTYQSMQGRAIIESLVGKGVDALKGLAKDGDIDALAYRYALKELNPFAILGPDYSRFNLNGELNLFDPATGQGALTDEYLVDRAAMLTWKLKLAMEDKDASQAAYSKTGTPDAYFKDFSSGLTLNLGGQGAVTDKRRFVFGTDSAETLSGGTRNDNRYGGGGNDVLTGRQSQSARDDVAEAANQCEWRRAA